MLEDDTASSAASQVDHTNEVLDAWAGCKRGRKLFLCGEPVAKTQIRIGTICSASPTIALCRRSLRFGLRLFKSFGVTTWRVTGT